MDSINRHIVHDRIARVYDTLTGAQGTGKHVKNYVKELRKSVGLKDITAGTGNDFLRDFGAGL